MKIIAFGASNSLKSINQQFAKYTLSQFDGIQSELLNLNDYKLPMFSVDDERENGFPDKAKEFVEKIAEADLLIVSLAEHNGNYTAAFKNLLDWGSRVKPNLFDTKMFLLSTSPGKGGARFAMEAAKIRFPRHGAEVLATFSLPEFEEHFHPEKGILNPTLKDDFEAIIDTLKKQFS